MPFLRKHYEPTDVRLRCQDKLIAIRHLIVSTVQKFEEPFRFKRSQQCDAAIFGLFATCRIRQRCELEPFAVISNADWCVCEQSYLAKAEETT